MAIRSSNWQFTRSSTTSSPFWQRRAAGNHVLERLRVVQRSDIASLQGRWRIVSDFRIVMSRPAAPLIDSPVGRTTFPQSAPLLRLPSSFMSGIWIWITGNRLCRWWWLILVWRAAAGGRFGAIKTTKLMHMWMYVTSKYSQIHTDMHCFQKCTCACIHDKNTYTYALPLSNAYVYVCTAKYSQIQSDTYRYELLSKMYMCMYSWQTYIHICIAFRQCICVCICMYAGMYVYDIHAHMHLIQLQWARIHADTVKYMQIQVCAYPMYNVHIRYALSCILCIWVCICVLYVVHIHADISIHMCAINPYVCNPYVCFHCRLV